MRIELRAIERTGHAFLAHYRRRLHRQCYLHRVRHLFVRFGDRFEANLCGRKIGICDYGPKPKNRRRVAMRGVRCAVRLQQFHACVRDASHRDLVVIGEIFASNGT